MLLFIALFLLVFCSQKTSINKEYLKNNPDSAVALGLDGMITPEGDDAEKAINDRLANSDVGYLGPLRVDFSLDPSNPSKTNPANLMNGKNAFIYQQAMALDVKAAAQGTTSPGAFQFLGCGSGGYRLGFTDINVQGSIPRGPDAAKQCGYIVSNPPPGTVVDFNFSVTEFGPKDRRQCISVRLKGFADSQRTAEFCAKTPLKKYLTLAVNAEFSLEDKKIEDRVSNVSIPTYAAFTASDSVKALASIRQPDQTNNRPRDLMGFVSAFKDTVNGAIKMDLFGKSLSVAFLGYNLKHLPETYHNAWLAIKGEVKTGIKPEVLNGLKLKPSPPNKYWEIFKTVSNINNDIYSILTTLDINKFLDTMPESPLKDQMAIAWKMYDDFNSSPIALASFYGDIALSSRNFIFEKGMKIRWASGKNPLFKTTLKNPAAQKKFYSWLNKEGKPLMKAAREDIYNLNKTSSLLGSAGISSNVFQRMEQKIQASADQLYLAYTRSLKLGK
jgi:hypothetical protein